MPRQALLAWLALPATLFAEACLADKGPVGIACLQQVDKLPYVYTGVRAAGFSSHDRSGGIGDAGNFLGQSGSEYTMLDVAGPGCIYRIWVTAVSSTNRIRVYLDGESTPRVNKTVAEMFGGAVAPFLSPLVGDNTVSSGGYYCYVPMPFRTGCKITIDASACYYNIGWQAFSDSAGVTTFTGTEDVSGVVSQWNNCGTDPKGTADARTRAGTVAVANGAAVTLIDEAGPGSLNRIRISVPRLDTYDGISKEIMWNTRLRVYWDNETTPRVDAPIGPFAGSFFPGTTVRSLLIGTTTPSQFYCYFPMPFGTRARVEIYNGCPYGIGISSLSYEIGIADMPNAALMLAARQIGYFAARWYEADVTGGGPDFPWANVTGTGVAVGLSLNMVGPYGADRGYLEGDERIHYDGSLTPAIYGTGTEDFFNGGFYFDRGTFYRPLHGNTSHITSPTDTTSCYRLFLGDRMQYKNGFRGGIEHGGYNEKNGKYSCVLYTYEAGPATLTQTDTLDVGDTASETAHSYVISGQKWSGTSTLYYEGDDDHVASADNGRSHGGYSQFVAAVDSTNGGVILRRRMDYSTADQKAYVYVDGSLAGTWYDAGNNNAKSWRDSDFMVPCAFTSGKSSITVKLVYVSGAWWTEYRYWVLSVRDTSAQSAAITGHVYASGGGALQGVRVTATPGSGAADTSQTGLYTISPLQPGSYTVTASKFGYITQSKSVTVSSGGTSTVDFTLAPAQYAYSPSQARSFADGTWVRMDNLIVTAVFDSLGRFYAERADRSGGIGVVASGVVLGDQVSVTGQAATVDGERVLQNAAVLIAARGQTVPRPVTMNHRSLGGGADGYQGAVVNKAEANLYANGRCTIGMLAHIWGKVSYSDVSGGHFYLVDGFGISDGSGRAGVRIAASGLPIPSAGRQIGATGISCATIIGGKVARLLRPRNSGDITYAPTPNLLANPGFETGNQTGWSSGGVTGSVQCASWFGGITAHGGSCFNGLAVDGGTANGYLYQRVPANVGSTYYASAWSCVYWGNNNSSAARNRIGIDPNGGTGAPAASTVWSAWDTQPSAFTWQWHNIYTSAVAASGYVTVYLDMNQQTSAGWHINCFDDADCHEM